MIMRNGRIFDLCTPEVAYVVRKVVGKSRLVENVDANISKIVRHNVPLRGVN